MTNKVESHIIQLVKAQKFEAAVNGIVEGYSQLLYAHVFKMVGENEGVKDVLQNTFVKIWKGLKGFKHQSKLSTWLIAIASNEAINYLNKRNKLKTSELFVERSLAQTTDGLKGERIEVLLENAIATLPLKQKQVFVMRYYDEIKYKDMSEILGTSEGALKATYHHAVKKIEAFLSAH